MLACTSERLILRTTVSVQPKNGSKAPVPGATKVFDTYLPRTLWRSSKSLFTTSLLLTSRSPSRMTYVGSTALSLV